IRGLNHYPQDIEHTVERSHRSLRQGCGAAFTVEGGSEERLAIVQEVEPDPELEMEALMQGIRAAIAEGHDLQPHAIVLIKPGSIIKTSSGKIQRSACRAAFLDGSLDVVVEWRASEAVEAPEPSLPEWGESLTPEAVRQWLSERLAQRV